MITSNQLNEGRDYWKEQSLAYPKASSMREFIDKIVEQYDSIILYERIFDKLSQRLSDPEYQRKLKEICEQIDLRYPKTDVV